ncbi:MAG TPA: antibiotic biosynthesis monooxygenase family protein [Candidatus Thermoplasmatota archaeon]|jgi:hypothetical protein|nr:antibiotic biosynthesis monooxygenase family protein [Candidatus Thermoplasmatota archaeon]
MSLVRTVHIEAAPGKGQAVEKLLGELVPAIRALPGCEGVTAFGDHGEGTYGMFVVWDTVAHADAARDVIGPRLQGGLHGNVREPPDIRMYEVIGAPAPRSRAPAAR